MSADGMKNGTAMEKEKNPRVDFASSQIPNLEIHINVTFIYVFRYRMYVCKLLLTSDVSLFSFFFFLKKYIYLIETYMRV